MAAFYIDSNASGADDGTTWADAYPDIDTAIQSKAAGDIFYVASNHDFDNGGTSITYNWPASSHLNPCMLISSSTAAEPPTTFTRGAKESTSASNADVIFGSGQDGSAVFIGFDFESNDTFSLSSDMVVYFFDCKFQFVGASASAEWTISGDPYFENCDFVFDHASQGFNLVGGGQSHFIECATSGTSITGSLFGAGSGSASCVVRGLDLSTGFATTAAMVGIPTATGTPVNDFYFAGVKLPTSWTGDFTSGTNLRGLHKYEFWNIDSGNTIYKFHLFRGEGEAAEETTTVHTGTYDGTNKYSIKLDCIDTGTQEGAGQPMWFHVTEMWADANQTFTVRLTSDSTLTDRQFWIEVEAPDSTNGALSKFFRSRNANYFLAGTTLTSGSGWTSAKTNQYQAAVTVSGCQAGVHRVTAYLVDDAATTVYIDPEVSVS